jgi:predicted nucleic acid-binding protein
VSRSVLFLDASALVHYYAPLGTDRESLLIHNRIDRLFEDAMKSSGRLVLQIPNICMAECAGAFAKLCFEKRSFGSGDFARDTYRELRDALLNDVGRDRLIHSYELRRSHFAGIEDIFLQDYELPAPRQGNRLSANDALILSMANEYRLAHPADSVAIVTEDRRIVDFCRAFRDDYPRGVRISTQNAV